MTSLEQRAAELRKEKYGTDKLDYELVQNPKDALPKSIDNGPTKPCIHEVNRIDYLKQKFGIKGNSLECEGWLGKRLEQSHEDKSDKKFTAQANWNGAKVPLCLEIFKT